MIKITTIFGEDAVREYEENNELPSEEWLADNGGVVDEKEFKTLEEYKAVSAETAAEMAEGALRISKADVSVSVTGEAGPSREDDKPVGLVYIGCCYKGETHVKECDLSGDRHTIRCQSTKEALKFVLDIIKTNR